MVWTEFSRKVVAGAIVPALALGLAPTAAFAEVGLAAGEASVAGGQALAAGFGAAGADEVAAGYDGTFAFSESGIAASGADESSYSAGFDEETGACTLTIKAAGTYYIDGSCSNGSIVVKKGTTGVTLVLGDLSLTADGTSPLVCKKSTEVVVDVEGTVVLVDAEDPADEDSTDEAVADAFEGAAIKAKAGAVLNICGTGTLTADGSACKNAIKGGEEATVKITGSVQVNAIAANTGIASDGEVDIAGGTVNAQAGNDGIKADPDEDDAESAGMTLIEGGVVNVTASDDGVKGLNTTISAGEVTVSAGDDGIKAERTLTLGTSSGGGPVIDVVKSAEGLEGATVDLLSGTGSIVASDDGVNAANGDLAAESTELFNLNIAGGDWTVNAQGDGLDSNGNITMTGGKMVVYGPTQGGNGVFDVADGAGSFTVSGGELLGMGTSDMAVTPTGGTYVVFGAAGGAAGPGFAGRGDMGFGEAGQSGMFGGQGGMGRFRPMSDEQTDGAASSDLDVQAFGDGWNMPVANGSNYSISAGQTVAVSDSSGNALISTAAAKSASWVLYASGDLQEGQTYALSANGSQIAIAQAASGAGAAQGGAPGQPGQGQQPAGGFQPGDGARPGQDQGAQPAQPGDEPGQGEQPDDGRQSGGSQQPPAAPADEVVLESGQMARLYNPNSGEHFYTASSEECANLEREGWQYEGVAWTAPELSGDPVWRLYNPNAGDHHYTLDAAERDMLVAAGWNDEGVGWYSDEAHGQELYRLYNPNAQAGAHHYTADAAERDGLIVQGWVDEGVGWYALAR